MKLRKDGSLTIRLPAPLKEALERAAEADRRSLSQMVGLALEKFLEARNEWPPTGTKKPRTTARRR